MQHLQIEVSYFVMNASITYFPVELMQQIMTLTSGNNYTLQSSLFRFHNLCLGKRV
jgi:hypothetical protein